MAPDTHGEAHLHPLHFPPPTFTHGYLEKHVTVTDPLVVIRKAVRIVTRRSLGEHLQDFTIATIINHRFSFTSSTARLASQAVSLATQK